MAVRRDCEMWLLQTKIFSEIDSKIYSEIDSRLTARMTARMTARLTARLTARSIPRLTARLTMRWGCYRPTFAARLASLIGALLYLLVMPLCRANRVLIFIGLEIWLLVGYACQRDTPVSEIWLSEIWLLARVRIGRKEESKIVRCHQDRH